MRLPSFWRFAGLAVGRGADLLSAARGAHDAGELRVGIRGAGSGDQHALAIAEEQSSAGKGPALPLVVRRERQRGTGSDARSAARAGATRLPSSWRFAGLAVGRGRAPAFSCPRCSRTRESRAAIPGAGITVCGDRHVLAIADEQWPAECRGGLLLIVVAVAQTNGPCRNAQSSQSGLESDPVGSLLPAFDALLGLI